jgi:hypothetical protein
MTRTAFSTVKMAKSHGGKSYLLGVNLSCHRVHSTWALVFWLAFEMMSYLHFGCKTYRKSLRIWNDFYIKQKTIWNTATKRLTSAFFFCLAWYDELAFTAIWTFEVRHILKWHRCSRAACFCREKAREMEEDTLLFSAAREAQSLISQTPPPMFQCSFKL